MHKSLNRFSVLLVLLLSVWQGSWAGNDYGSKDNIQDGVILHCFDWTLTDIKNEMPNIAKAGFSAVQTSPVSKGGGYGAVWYDVYRPQDYTIGNGIGNESQLRDLCTTAHQYGVKVIVDVVANHTDYPNCQGYMADRSRYHDPFDVSNWNDRYQVTHGKIGMMDNKTEDSGVQNYIKQFVQSLKSCGVDGVRWDAAKHIGLPSEGDQFWAVVADQSMYNYGEILDSTGGNDGQLFPEYQRYISITDNGYGNSLAGSFSSGQVNPTVGNFNQRGAADNKLVYWGESHDTYANDGGSSKYISQNNIDRAYAITAGNNGATSLYFSRPSQTDKNAIKIGEKGSTHFTSPEVVQVNYCHNLCAGEDNWYVHENGVAAQVRKSGTIIALGSGGNRSVTFANGGDDGKGYAVHMTEGTYTDKVGGGTFTVTASTISGQVGSTGIAVIYSGEIHGGGDTPTPTPDPQPTSDYDAELDYAGENCVFLESSTYSYVYTWNDDNLSISGAWPGSQMTKVGTTSAGTPVYKYTFSGDIPTNIIFNDGGSNQTADLVFTNRGYYVNESMTKTITKVKGGGDDPTPTPDPQPTTGYEAYIDKNDEISVFFETSDGKVPSVWVWNDADNYNVNGSWPGDEMTLQGTLSSGAKVYKWTYSGSLTSLPTGVIFTHDGGTKYNDSADGTFVNHGYYTTSSPLSSTKTITTTGIKDINAAENVARKGNIWYTITGARLSGKPSQAGIYIHNGRKIVVR